MVLLKMQSDIVSKKNITDSLLGPALSGYVELHHDLVLCGGVISLDLIYVEPP